MLDESKAIATIAGPHPGEASGNRLLAALPPPYQAGATTLDAEPGQILLDPEDPATEVFFPSHGAVLVVLAMLPDRKPVETAQVGAEGATGALLGPSGSPNGFRLQVLTAGRLTRLPATDFAAAMAQSEALRQAVARHAGARQAQAQIGVACAALHSVEERTARWLLDLQFRSGDRALPVTQEGLADLLGVRRTTITRVVANLEGAGFLRHRRGRIIVMDRAGLENAACPCHGMARRLFAATLPT